MRGFKDDCVDHLLSSVGLLCCLLGKWYTLACTEVTAHYHQVFFFFSIRYDFLFFSFLFFSFPPLIKG